MTICIQCALEEFVRTGDVATLSTAAAFDESPDDHMRRVHPDPVATQARRRVLEAEAARLMEKLNPPRHGA